jgi:hypothetical protein
VEAGDRVARTKRKAITLPSTGLTYDDLKAIEASTPRSEEHPTSLPLDRIFVADDVFQPREGLEDYHVRNLAAAVREGEQPLDRLLVVAIGEQHFVVDGHHRLAAYISAEWSKDIPVQVFDGDLDAAEVASIGSNSKDKLAVPKSRKLEKAWRLVLRGVHSIAVIANNAMVAPRTVSYMRARLIELGAEEAAQMSWADVKHGRQEGGDWDAEAWIEREASEMAQRVCAVHNKEAVLKSPEVFGAMIEMVNRDLIPGLLGRWIGDHPGLMQEYIDDQAAKEAMGL